VAPVDREAVRRRRVEGDEQRDGAVRRVAGGRGRQPRRRLGLRSAPAFTGRSCMCAAGARSLHICCCVRARCSRLCRHESRPGIERSGRRGRAPGAAGARMPRWAAAAGASAGLPAHAEYLSTTPAFQRRACNAGPGPSPVVMLNGTLATTLTGRGSSAVSSLRFARSASAWTTLTCASCSPRQAHPRTPASWGPGRRS